MRKCGNMCLYRRALTGVLAVLLAVEISACGGKAKPGQETGVSQKAEITQEKASAPVWKDMRPERSMELSYAKQFSVDYYDGGYDLIQVQDDSTCLVVPEGAAVPEGLPASITVLQKPLDHVYLAATSAMDLIAALGRVDRITLSGTKESGWYVDAARQAMEDGTLSYAGKYSAPDYEQILSSGCDLALESTMIYHVPDVKAQLEQLKIPVFVERSSYEEHPLGRMEWIRLYGVLFDAEALRKVSAGSVKRVFSQAEEKLISSAPESDRDIIFTTLWTLKEAYSKADGRGLAAMGEAHFSLNGDNIISDTALYFRRFFLDGYVISVCCSENTDIRLKIV